MPNWPRVEFSDSGYCRKYGKNSKEVEIQEFREIGNVETSDKIPSGLSGPKNDEYAIFILFGILQYPWIP